MEVTFNKQGHVLGDRHNFGRAVRVLDNATILKPRPTVWEYLVLDPRSDLRKLLNACALGDVLPALEVEPVFDFSSEARVDRLVVSEIDESLSLVQRDQLGEGLGALLALAVWMGFCDLHYENVLVGMQGDRVIVAPVDLECAFKDVVPTTTMLLPNKSISHGVLGYRFLSNPALSKILIPRICYGYIQTLRHLEAVTPLAYEAIRKLGAPLYTRVLLKSTAQYARILKGQEKASLITEEQTQIDRGDIPYFFRRIDRRELLYLKADRLIAEVNPAAVSAYTLNSQRIFDSGLGLAREGLRNHYKYGLAAIAQACIRGFDLASYSGSHKGFEVTHNHDHMALSYGSCRVKVLAY